MTRLIYDGSFEGLLTALFEVYEYRYKDVEILPTSHTEIPSLFGEQREVLTQTEKAARILKFLESSIEKDGIRTLLYAFLSEQPTEMHLLHVLRESVAKPHASVMNNFADEKILQIHQWAKSVGREKHRMEAFLRFEKMKDGIFAAKIAPDFNVCGLILPHFRHRYQDQSWVIYDIVRGYGFFWDTEKILDITLHENDFTQKIRNPKELLHEEEQKYQVLWQSYFRETNIKERKNMKLHLQHVPRRYWKYLTEKW